MLARKRVRHAFFWLAMLDEDAIEVLRAYLLPERWVRLSNAVRSRTRWVTVAFDSLVHSHNVNAVLRTCECFGIQDVHVVTGGSSLATYPGISRGALEWLSVHEYPTVSDQIAALRSSGYRLIGTGPHRVNNSVALRDFSPLQAPVALLFGQERHGMSAEALEAVEECVYIPMVGFGESFNISVAAGIILNSVRERIPQRVAPYCLSTRDANRLLLSWLKKDVKSAELLLERAEGRC